MNKELLKLKEESEARIIEHYGDPTEACGIYIFNRYDNEKGKRCYYVGQAKNLRRRMAQHLLEYDHIGLSLKKHDLYHRTKNPNGWQCEYMKRPESLLDKFEREVIASIQSSVSEYELYNITNGGQGKGKVDINKRAERGGWRKGKDAGYEKAYAEIAEIIEKYTFGLLPKMGKTAQRKTQELNEKLKGANKS